MKQEPRRNQREIVRQRHRAKALERRGQERQRRIGIPYVDRARFSLFNCDGSTLIIINDKPTAFGDELSCARGCNCNVCRVRRYASALRFKRHPPELFILDPKFPAGFWRRVRDRWGFQSFQGIIGLANPKVSEAASAALMAEPMAEPMFFVEDLMMNVNNPCCETAICGCTGIVDETLTATFASADGCSALNGATVTLSPTMPGGQTWNGTLSSVSCFGTRTLTMSCNGSEWTLQIESGACLASASLSGEATCDPFSIVFGPYSYSHIPMSACECCSPSGGTFTVTVAL